MGCDREGHSPVKIWWLGRKAGFRKNKVYPHPVTQFKATYSLQGSRCDLPEVSVELDRRPEKLGFITAKWGTA